MEFSTSDYVLLALVGLGAFYYLFKDSLFGSGNASPRNLNGNGSTYGGNTGKVGPASADGAGTGGNSIQAAGRDIAKALKITVSLALSSLPRSIHKSRPTK